jgi:RNA:NAD 2'-phosphotransferase (TPT1/KptA family)
VVESDEAQSPLDMAESKGSHSRKKKEDDPDVWFSKSLSYITRHGAEKEGLKVEKGPCLFAHTVVNLGSLIH